MLEISAQERAVNAVMVEIEMYEQWARRKTDYYRDRAKPVLDELYRLHSRRDQAFYEELLEMSYPDFTSSGPFFDECAKIQKKLFEMYDYEEGDDA